MDISGKNIALLVDNFFEQKEFEVPLASLRRAGAEVTVISTGSSSVQGMNHADKGDIFTVDQTLDKANSEDYDALVVPGGVLNADSLRSNKDAQQWAVAFLQSNRTLAMICHAPWLLVSSDCIEGRRLTSYPSIQEDVRNAGADWVDAAVVIDTNLISSRTSDDLPQFCTAIIKRLSRKVRVLSASVTHGQSIGSEDEVDDDLQFRALGYSKVEDTIIRFDEQDMRRDETASPKNIVPKNNKRRKD